MTTPTKQPTGDAKHAPSPYGDDVEQAALALTGQAHKAAGGDDPLDRYDALLWWRLVHVRTAELLNDVARGEPLAELAGGHTYREIEVMLAKHGTPLSDSTITKLIGRWRAWKAAASRQ